MIDNELLKRVSESMMTCSGKIGKNDTHIPRKETKALFDWICSSSSKDDNDTMSILLGKAGSGKTVVLYDLYQMLVDNNIPTLALKSDRIFSSAQTENKKNEIETAIEAIQENKLDNLMVLLIDQLDVLSYVLSSDRSPLETVMTWIEKVRSNPYARIICSCRTYDFNYDRAFAYYQNCRTISIGPLELIDVNNALIENKKQPITTESELYAFLSFPLHLALYCGIENINNLSTQPTLSMLYDELWNEKIINVNEKKIQTESLICYLFMLVQEMIERQSIAIPSQSIPSQWTKAQLYLLSTNLIEKTNGNTLQFVHQTLFDYVYARLFYENKKSIKLEFPHKHQGLFSRPRIKQLLDYLHDIDKNKYIDSLNEILFDVDETGKLFFRFQIQHLALSSFSQYNFTDLDKRFLTSKVFKNAIYAHAFCSQVHSIDGFLLIEQYIKDIYQYVESAPLEWQMYYLHAIYNIVCQKQKRYDEIVLESMSKVSLTELLPQNKNTINQIINRLGTNSIALSTTLLIVQMIDNNPEEFGLALYYRELAKVRPSYVANRMLQHIEACLKNTDSNSGYDLRVANMASEICTAIRDSDIMCYVNMTDRMVRMMIEKSILTEDYDLKSSLYFYLYSRSNNDHNFPDKIYSGLLSAVEQCVQTRCPAITSYLTMSSQTDKIELHVVAMTGWLADIKTYNNDAYQYLLNNLGREYPNSLLVYYQMLLLQAICPFLNEKDVAALSYKIIGIYQQWEKTLPSKEFRTRVARHSYIGYTQWQLLNAIPLYLIKDNRVKNRLSQLNRKFGECVKEEPNRIMCYTGCPAMKSEVYEVMNDNSYLNSMRKYTSDFSADPNAPSLTGHAIALQLKIHQNPDRFYNIFMRAVLDDTIPRTYVIYALETFISLDYDATKLMGLYMPLVHSILKKSLNAENVDQIRTVELMSYYIRRQKKVPKEMFDFVLKIAKEAPDWTYKRPNFGDESDIYMIGSIISHLRGSAINLLERYNYDSLTTDDIVDTLMTVAKKGNVESRCAVLFQLGLLNCDENKLQDIFALATRELDEKIVQMAPTEDHPIKRLIERRYPQIKSYFEKCMDRPTSYQSNVIWQWEALLLGQEQSATMLFRMADSDVSVCAKLIHHIARDRIDLCSKLVKDTLIRYANVDDKNVGDAFECIYHNIHNFTPQDIKELMNVISKSLSVKYQTSQVYSFIKDFAIERPEWSIEWIKDIYNTKKSCGLVYNEADAMAEILIRAYHYLSNYDTDSKFIEDALDLFDQMLLSQDLVTSLDNCLKESLE